MVFFLTLLSIITIAIGVSNVVSEIASIILLYFTSAVVQLIMFLLIGNFAIYIIVSGMIGLASIYILLELVDRFWTLESVPKQKIINGIKQSFLQVIFTWPTLISMLVIILAKIKMKDPQ